MSRHPLKPEVVVHLSVIRILRLRSAFLVVAPGLGFAFSDDTEAPAARDVDAVALMTAEGRWAAATWAGSLADRRYPPRSRHLRRS